MLIRSARHTKPPRIVYNKLGCGPVQEIYFDRGKREVQKNELRLYKKEKTWPNNNSCTRELGMGTITAAPNVALQMAREVPVPFNPRPTRPQPWFCIEL